MLEIHWICPQNTMERDKGTKMWHCQLKSHSDFNFFVPLIRSCDLSFRNLSFKRTLFLFFLDPRQKFLKARKKALKKKVYVYIKSSVDHKSLDQFFSSIFYFISFKLVRGKNYLENWNFIRASRMKISRQLILH